MNSYEKSDKKSPCENTEAFFYLKAVIATRYFIRSNVPADL
jgi:hypothetical protein